MLMYFSRISIAILIAINVFSACNNTESSKKDKSISKQKQETSFTITGYVKGAPQGLRFVLVNLSTDAMPDTALFKGDHFEFKGNTPEPIMAEIYYLDSIGNPGQPLKLLLENAYINIEANVDSFSKADVIGGPFNTDYADLKDILHLYWDSVFAIANNIRMLEENKDTQQVKLQCDQYNSMLFETRSAVRQYAMEHPFSIASAYYIFQYYSGNVDVAELDSVYNSYDSSILNYTYVKKIKDLLDVTKRTVIGQQAPELSLNNKDFDTATISSYKGKILLINFWASWCESCRQQNKELVKLYKTYKPKGFDVLSVSLDSSKQIWQRAIKQDRLNWQQVSDFKGMNSSAAKLYNINNLPANVLVDKQGKIIGKNIYGASLTARLAELLK